MAPLVRPARRDDAAEVAAIYRPLVDASVVSFETVAPGPDEMARRMEATLPHRPWLVCEVDGGVAGYAYAGPYRHRAAYRWSVETSVYVDSDHRRRGVGRLLYATLFTLLRAQGFVNAYAGITLPSPASVSFHESMGFRPLGVYRHVGYKFGAWHDVGWWSLDLADPPATPSPPVDLDALARRGTLAALLKPPAD